MRLEKFDRILEDVSKGITKNFPTLIPCMSFPDETSKETLGWNLREISVGILEKSCSISVGILVQKMKKWQ